MILYIGYGIMFLFFFIWGSIDGEDFLLGDIEFFCILLGKWAGF